MSPENAHDNLDSLSLTEEELLRWCDRLLLLHKHPEVSDVETTKIAEIFSSIVSYAPGSGEAIVQLNEEGYTKLMQAYDVAAHLGVLRLIQYEGSEPHG